MRRMILAMQTLLVGLGISNHARYIAVSGKYTQQSHGEREPEPQFPRSGDLQCAKDR